MDKCERRPRRRLAAVVAWRLPRKGLLGATHLPEASLRLRAAACHRIRLFVRHIRSKRARNNRPFVEHNARLAQVDGWVAAFETEPKSAAKNPSCREPSTVSRPQQAPHHPNTRP